MRAHTCLNTSVHTKETAKVIENVDGGLQPFYPMVFSTFLIISFKYGINFEDPIFAFYALFNKAFYSPLCLGIYTTACGLLFRIS